MNERKASIKVATGTVTFYLDRLYPLDGSFHPSVATRLSALHYPNEKAAALCRPTATALCVEFDDGSTEDQARAERRTICARCRKIHHAARSR